jgi:hypothetical protein
LEEDFLVAVLQMMFDGGFYYYSGSWAVTAGWFVGWIVYLGSLR